MRDVVIAPALNLNFLLLTNEISIAQVLALRWKAMFAPVTHLVLVDYLFKCSGISEIGGIGVPYHSYAAILAGFVTMIQFQGHEQATHATDRNVLTVRPALPTSDSCTLILLWIFDGLDPILDRLIVTINGGIPKQESNHSLPTL
jgi:hypothetical protein